MPNLTRELALQDSELARNERGEPLLAWLGDARAEAVEKVLAAPVETGDGRSRWHWLRLANGDLFLAVAPQGGTYEELEGEPGAGWGT